MTPPDRSSRHPQVVPGGTGPRAVIRNPADRVVIAALLLVAITCQWLVLESHGRPAVIHNADAGLVSSFVAGWLHPERFAQDFVLDEKANYAFYVAVNLVYVAGLSLLTDDIGTAYLLLYLPLVLFQLVGFYLLGRYILGSRFWSVVLACLTFPPIWVWGGELWGTHLLPLTRMTFGGALPLLLLLFLRFGSRSEHLPWLFGLCGASVYLHPVSAPTVAVGLSLASFALVPDRRSVLPHLGRLALGALVFAVVVAPFAIVLYLGSAGEDDAPAGAALPAVEEAKTMFAERTGSEYYDAGLAIRQMIDRMSGRPAVVWLFGLAAFFAVPLLDRRRTRLCLFLGLFLAGIVLGSAGIAVADQAFAAASGRQPLQLDLIRNLRFVYPVLLVGLVLAGAELHRMLGGWRVVAVGLPVVAVAFTLYWWRVLPNRLTDAIGIGAIPEMYRTYDPEASEILAAMKALPAGRGVLPLTGEETGLAVRYAALQPVVYLEKDGNALFYSGSPRRVEWAERRRLVTALYASADRDLAARNLRQVIDRTGAKYVLLQTGHPPPAVAEAARGAGPVVLERGRWLLIRVASQGG